MKKYDNDYHIFKYFLTALQLPNIPTIIPRINNNKETINVNGVGSTNCINCENILPSK